MRKNSKYIQDAKKPGTSENGFSIVELMVSLVIFLIATGAIFGVMQVARQSRSVVSHQVGMNKAVRQALSVIGHDSYNAGYGYPLKNTVVLPDNRISARLGVPADIDANRDTAPPIIAGNNITTNTFNQTANVKTDQVTFLFKDSTFNPVGAAGQEVSQPLAIKAWSTLAPSGPISATSSGIDEIKPASGSNSKCRVNDIYLITGNTGGSTLALATALSGSDKIQFANGSGNGDVLGFNQPGTGPLTNLTAPASIIRVKMITYFVTADGVLTRREFANVPPAVPAVDSVDEPLVYGVEDFQVKYVMDDGSLVDNPSAGPDGIAGNADDDQTDLAAVRQIRFTISVRSTELNPNGQPTKLTMTSTFSTKNLGYEAN